MPRRTENIAYQPRSNHRTRSRNVNAHDRQPVHVLSDLISIGHSIIADLKDYNRHQMDIQLPTRSTTAHDQGSNPSTRRTLEQILNDFHEFEHHQRRESRSIGIGDGHVQNQSSETKEESFPTKSNATTVSDEHRYSQQGRTSMIPDGTPKALKRIRQKSAETALPSPVPRTICTRSSTTNALKNNNAPIQSPPVSAQRIQKGRLHSNNVEKPRGKETKINPPKSKIGNDSARVRVARKKIQLSAPSRHTDSGYSREGSNFSNEF